jgi:hypothetical protein
VPTARLRPFLTAAAGAVVSLVGAALLIGTPLACARDPAPTPVLWVWERPEDLSFLATSPDRRDRGVRFAVLAGTLTLAADAVTLAPRRQPLTLPEAGARTAVVRIEVDPTAPPSLSEGQRREVAAAVLGWRSDDAVGVQVDFDATVGQRAFYAALLTDLDAALPDDVSLSITALASWCGGDPWLGDLPIDEAVPMLYRMGPDGSGIRAALARGEDWREPLCRRSYGLSSDETVPPLLAGRRLWLFADQPWTAASYRALRSAAEAAVVK